MDTTERARIREAYIAYTIASEQRQEPFALALVGQAIRDSLAHPAGPGELWSTNTTVVINGIEYLVRIDRQNGRPRT